MRGGLVAFPTETVYGLGARADLPEAVAKLRVAKGRSAEKAFTVHVDSRTSALRFIPSPTGLAKRLMRKAWPGPLTLIIASTEINADTSPSGLSPATRKAIFYDGWVGLRCPDDPFAGELLRAATAPIVASSANIAGNPPPHTAEAVLRDLDGTVDLLIDGGRTRHGKPSSIVKLHGNRYELIREGVYDAGSIARLAAMKLLFVCTGNTCRSPMAAGLASKGLADRLNCRIADLPDHGIFIQSAGTAGGYSGAANAAIRVMAQRGIDISNHSSTVLTPELVHQADFVFTMTHEHRAVAVGLARSAEDRVRVLIPGKDLPDPVGGTLEDYEACARTIEEGLASRIEEVLQ